VSASPNAGSHAPRRILFVHHRSELGGAPASLYYLLQELDRGRFEPHVFCPAGPSAELFRSAGATVHTGAVAGFTHIWASVYQGRRWLLLAREVLRLPKHVADFRRVLHHGGFDLVHLNDSPLIPAAFLAKRAGIPIIWHLRSALPADGGRRSALIRAAIRSTGSAVIAINEDVAASFDVDARVIANSIDLERFAPGDRNEARESVGVPLAKHVVSYFGYIYPSKGFREFIRAAGHLRDARLDVSFLVVGGAVRTAAFFQTFKGRVLKFFDLARDYEQEALTLVRDLGLQDAVTFVPFTRRPEMLYRATDVVVAPSRGPELGRPVIEAAASGIPVVASGSRTGGGVVIPGETGLLAVDPRPEAIAAAVQQLLADKERLARIGQAARRHAERRFDPAANARQVEAVYDALSRRRSQVLLVVADLEGAQAVRKVLPLLANRGEFVAAVAPGVAEALGTVALPLVPWDELASTAHRVRLVHVAGATPWTVDLGKHPAPVVWQLAGGMLPPTGLTPPAAVIVRDAELADDLPPDWPVEVIHGVGGPNGVRREEARDRLGLQPGDVAVGLVATHPSRIDVLDFARAGRLLARQDAPIALLPSADSAAEAESLHAAVDIAVALDNDAALLQTAGYGAALVVATRASGSVAVSGESAILVPPRAAAAVAAAVDRIARDDVLRERLGGRARELARALGEGALALEQITRVYDRVAR
jgi:glycosyltransferase involved in cell wall biosynthesis